MKNIIQCFIHKKFYFEDNKTEYRISSRRSYYSNITCFSLKQFINFVLFKLLRLNLILTRFKIKMTSFYLNQVQSLQHMFCLKYRVCFLQAVYSSCKTKLTIMDRWKYQFNIKPSLLKTGHMTSVSNSDYSLYQRISLKT